MPIICLEGASAVGKTTMANFLKDNYGAFVVPEVNQLFTKPENAPTEWYLERQIERWTIAKKQSQSHPLAILDGDPFQPLWYNWVYEFINLQGLECIEQLYLPKLQNKTLDFPDGYFILSANETELRQRRANDINRTRSNFEKHLKLIQPQIRYFQTMKSFSGHLVYFLEARTIKASAEIVLEKMANFVKRDDTDSVMLFNRMIRWLRENEA
jgi:hypothetical protein